MTFWTPAQGGGGKGCLFPKNPNLPIDDPAKLGHTVLAAIKLILK
jgi:hypothetical protein